MAEDDYDDSFSEDSDDEGVEEGQGSVELFGGYYRQGDLRPEYIYDVLEAARYSASGDMKYVCQPRLSFVVCSSRVCVVCSIGL